MERTVPSKADLDRFNRSYAPYEGCWHWTGTINHNGYGHVHFMGKQRRAHRVSFFIRHGYFPEGLVLHTCDNRACVNPDHLKEGDPKSNTADMMIRGRDRHLEGEDCPHAVLTEANIREIRARRTAGEMAKDIAKVFKVSATHISQICKFKRWAHVS